MLLGFLTAMNTNKQLPLTVSNHLLNYTASPPRRPQSNYVYGSNFQQNRQTDKLKVSERNAQSNFHDIFGGTTHFIRIITPRSPYTIRALAAILGRCRTCKLCGHSAAMHLVVKVLPLQA
jgi:hypothetical protein